MLTEGGRRTFLLEKYARITTQPQFIMHITAFITAVTGLIAAVAEIIKLLHNLGYI